MRRPVVREFIAFLRAPSHDLAPDPTPVRTAIKLLGLQILALIVASPFLAAAMEVIDGEEFVGFDDISPLQVIILAVIVAPITEEAAFRLAVTRFRAVYLLIAGAVLGLLFPWALPLPLLVAYLVVALGMVALGVVALADSRADAAIARWWTRRFGAIVYLSALLFGLIHVGNYSFAESGLITAALAPLLVLPQALGGLVLAYCRVRLGIAWAMLQHAAYNAPLVAAVALTL